MQHHAIRPRVEIDHRPVYGDTYRHWCPESEPYASADVLIQYLRLGWALDKLVAVETIYHTARRQSNVYYFTLHLDDRILEMPVLANPVVLDLIKRHKLTILRINVAREETC